MTNYCSNRNIFAREHCFALYPVIGCCELLASFCDFIACYIIDLQFNAVTETHKTLLLFLRTSMPAPFGKRTLTTISMPAVPAHLKIRISVDQSSSGGPLRPAKLEVDVDIRASDFEIRRFDSLPSLTLSCCTMPRDMTGCGRYPATPKYPPFAFYTCVRMGDPEQLAKIMATDVYFITQDNGGGAPVHFATTYKQLDMVSPAQNFVFGANFFSGLAPSSSEQWR